MERAKKEETKISFVWESDSSATKYHKHGRPRRHRPRGGRDHLQERGRAAEAPTGDQEDIRRHGEKVKQFFF